MFSKYIYCLLLIVLQHTGSVQSIYKRWKPNTNFENPNNWNVGRVPCGSDIVKFATGDALSPTVYIQTNTTIKELWLPMNGELIFGDNSILSFTDTATDDANCPDADGELEYIRGPKEWVDPDNWCYSQTERGDCQDIPLLDSEKVPGLYDDVVFPPEKSFFVTLGVNMAFKVKSLKISGSSLSTSSFKSFVQSADGSRMFPPPNQGAGVLSSVTISRTKCKTPKSGCASGNDQGQILDEICKIYKDRCNRARCQSSLTPLASCCQICGGLFNVTIDTGFNITEFENILQTQFLSGKTGTEMIVSRLSIKENLVQLVIRDKTGEVSTKTAMDIKNDMDKDLSQGGHKYAISSVSLAVSGAGIGPNGPSANTGKLGGGGITGIVIGIMIAVAIVLLVLYLLNENNRRNLRNRMSRLTQPTSNVTMGGGNPITRRIQTLRHNFNRGDDDLHSIGTELGTINTSFENQMYGEPLDDRNIQDFHLSLSETQPATFDSSGFDNPLYDTKEPASTGKESSKKKKKDAGDSGHL
ncbi:protein amnionless isoform X2 [Patella vulgata]|uniref:protein amnionless isoform X2 n=1 Tax=Patella vulgata TaxID=6465 RepID=UPI0024A9E393|nr:protein amnionless isoform X2 [Patella vulgata]